MRLLLSFLFLLPGTVFANAQGAPVVTPQQQRELVLRIARDIVEPRYEALRAGALTQQQAWNAFCQVPSDGGVDALQNAFSAMVRVWSAVNMVRYGPVAESFRYERIEYWPERKTEVGRAMSRLLSGDDPITADAMPGKSVAVQGLTALERLLYDQGAREKLASADEEARRRCAAGIAISGNVAAVAGEVSEGWSDVVARIETGDEGQVREAAARFGTDFVTMFQVVGDQKIEGAMGDSADEARPRAAQYWRSGLSNIGLAGNLESAAAVAGAVLGSDSPQKAALSAAQELAEKLSAPLPQLVMTENGRREVLALRNAVRQARDSAGTSVPSALGVTIGFNSLDGD
jgi:uncharacterized protein